MVDDEGGSDELVRRGGRLRQRKRRAEEAKERAEAEQGFD